jgi:hypothetical protein
MKRILSGIDAYNALLTAPLPEKTKTYTPVSHKDVMKLVRQRLSFMGFRIDDEHYYTNQSGTVCNVVFVFQYVADPDLSMSATFVNSYDKTAKFQFKLGGFTKNGTVILHDGFAGSEIKRKHTGSALDVINNHIEECFNMIGAIWHDLDSYRNDLKKLMVFSRDANVKYLVGDMVLNKHLDSIQTNDLLGKLEHLDSTVSLYDLYIVFSSAMRNSHPKNWHQNHLKLAASFQEVMKSMIRPISKSIIPHEISILPLETVLEEAELPF